MITIDDLPQEYTLSQIKDLIKDGHPLYDPNDYKQVIDVGNGLLVMFGNHIIKTEALAMQLVKTRTNLPVPQLLAYINEEGNEATKKLRSGYLVMRKLPGVRLDSALEGMSEAADRLLSHR